MTSVVSLFSGAGGMDLGFELAGYKSVFQCEIDPKCRGVLRRHFPHVDQWSDITNLSGRHIVERINSHGKNADVVIWGSPCQDLSSVGRRAGLSGTKSTLFHEGIRIINEIREVTNNEYPKATVWENVAGALHTNRGADFGYVIDALARSRALVIEWRVLDAQDFGVPQRRRRVFVTAIFDPATAARCTEPILPVTKSAGRNRETNEYVTFYSTQGRQDRFTRDICTTLKANGTVCIVGHDTAPRRLTPVECERLMGWNDSWTAFDCFGNAIAHTHRYKMCGNGVVAPVAQWVAQRLHAVLKPGER